MTASVSIITLGVEDLKRSKSFYEAMGWQDTKASQKSVVFLNGHSVVLGLFGRAALAEDAGVQDTPSGFRGVALAINLTNETAVDALFARACWAGAKPVKRPQKVFWGGYSGYFGDPDGHLWEIAHNPFFELDENTGKLALEPL